MGSGIRAAHRAVELAAVTTSETASGRVANPRPLAVPGVVGTAVGSGKGKDGSEMARLLEDTGTVGWGEAVTRQLTPAIPDQCVKCGGGRLDRDREDEDTYVCAVCSKRHYRGRTPEVLAALAADLENPHIFRTTKWWGEPDEPRQLELIAS
jgi:hypothetical protein